MIKSLFLAFTLLFGFIGATHAQSDPLAKCVSENITEKDRTTLVRWLFVAMGAHPQLSGFALPSKESIDEANKATGALVTRLLAETCSAEFLAANKGAESNQVITRAFGGLGQLAVTELMYDREVIVSMSKFVRDVDYTQIATILLKK